MSDTRHEIRLRNPEDRDMIPGYVVKTMFALALIALAMVAYARVHDTPVVAVPPAAELVESREIVLIGGGAQAVRVETPDGRLLADMDHGGFVTVIQNGLQRERMKHKLSPTLPIRIALYANGRLAAEDPETGWSVELGNFGQDNRAAFERLMRLE